MMDWSNALVLQLLDLYRERECLWNPSDDHYKSKRRKLEAWTEIGGILQCDPIEVKKKIESLLSSFRRERQKPGTSWFAFKSMSFLMDKFQVKGNISTDNLLTQSYNCESLDENSSDHEYDPTADNEDTLAIPFISPEQKRPKFESPKPFRRTQLQDYRSDDMYTVLRNTFNKRSFRDDSAVYGDYVASKHRKFSQHTRNVVEHLIGNILFNADMGTYELTQCNAGQAQLHSTVSLSPKSYNSFPSPESVMLPCDDSVDVKRVPLIPNAKP